VLNERDEPRESSLTILRLREKARTALEDKFSLSAFHDEVIGAGALPMDVLETRMNEWIAAEGRVGKTD
jgi:uncharacterized protein (DUF885 family)